MAENRQQQQKQKMPHHCPHQRQEIRRLTKESSVKPRIGPSQRENKAKYRSVISEVEGAAGFVRTQERRRVSCFCAGQVSSLLTVYKKKNVVFTVKHRQLWLPELHRGNYRKTCSTIMVNEH